MITALRLVDFKNFADEWLKVGPFTVIVGANASGKSNIRDAFRLLHGIGRRYTLAEIIGGKYGAGGQEEWEQMRGAAREIVRFGQQRMRLEVDFRTEEDASLGPMFLLGSGRYELEIEALELPRAGFRVVRERLVTQGRTIFTSHPPGRDAVAEQEDEAHLLLRMDKTGSQKRSGDKIAVRPDQPALSQIRDYKGVAKPHKDVAEKLIELFGSMRFLDLVPERMRQPAFPGQTVLGDDGGNLPSVLQEICADDQRKTVLEEWIRELTPMDVEDFEFPHDQITGLVQLVIREGSEKRVSAYSASDGTLRFLAMLAALLGTNPARLYFFEEIDNGIHPSRLRLLLDLIEGQTAKGNLQVITTTHSPELLSMINDRTFDSTSVTFRDSGTANAVIRQVAALPNARELRRKQGLGALHAAGWIEDALTFEGEAGRWSPDQEFEDLLL